MNTQRQQGNIKFRFVFIVKIVSQLNSIVKQTNINADAHLSTQFSIDSQCFL